MCVRCVRCVRGVGVVVVLSSLLRVRGAARLRVDAEPRGGDQRGVAARRALALARQALLQLAGGEAERQQRLGRAASVQRVVLADRHVEGARLISQAARVKRRRPQGKRLPPPAQLRHEAAVRDGERDRRRVLVLEQQAECPPLVWPVTHRRQVYEASERERVTSQSLVGPLESRARRDAMEERPRGRLARRVRAERLLRNA